MTTRIERWARQDPPHLFAVLAGTVVFALYAATLAPTTQAWDASEYIATGHILGIPHPPGNPTFVLLARTWDVLLSPLGLSVATRINLLSASMSAAAHALWFLIAFEILGRLASDRFFRLTGASAAVLVSATTFTVWNQSNVNEKVYTVSLFTIALLSWLAFRWRQRVGTAGNDKKLVLMAFVLALSVGNHLMAFLAAPALALFVLVVDPRVLLRWRLVPLATAAVILGLSVHLFLPIRAAMNPAINEGAPTCASVGEALTSVVTYGRKGCEALSGAMTRSQYKSPDETEARAGSVRRQAPVTQQLVNFLQYFDWQWARSVDVRSTVFSLARMPLTLLFTMLGLLGAIQHARRDRPSFLYVLGLFGTVSVGLTLYLNFKLGWSMPGDPSILREVRERDYFFLVSFSLWGLWAGVGIASLWKSVAERMTWSLRRAVPVMGLALIPLALNAPWATRHDDWTARDFAYNLLMSVEPYGVLITHGDNDTFPLWYLQEVEGIRRDVTIAVPPYLDTPWYIKQLRDLSRPCPEGVDPEARPSEIVCQRAYLGTASAFAEPGASSASAQTREAAGDVVARAMSVARPTHAITKLDDAAIDAIASRATIVEQDTTLPMGNVEARLRAGQVLYPRQQFTLYVISDSVTDRPIHFTSPSEAEELGLGGYLVREGITYRLHNGPLPETAPAGYARMPADWDLRSWTGEWVNVPRTRELLEDVFVHNGGWPDGKRWKDEPSLSIPMNYAYGYLALAQAALQNREDADSARYEREARRWLAVQR